MTNHSQLALTTSDTDGFIQLWDIQTGVCAATFKGSLSTIAAVSHQNGFAGFLTPALVLAPQSDRGLIHGYTFGKGPAQFKYIVPEKLSAAACTHSGQYLIAGGISGRVYIYQVYLKLKFRSKADVCCVCLTPITRKSLPLKSPSMMPECLQEEKTAQYTFGT